MTKDKIQIFKRGEENITNGVNIITGLNSNLYRISGVTYSADNSVKTVERIKHEEYNEINQSPLTKPTSNRPVYWIKNNIINFAPDLGTFQIRYIVKPEAPKWTYTVVDEKPLYNPNIPGFQDFELHPSEQQSLAVKILQLSGVTIKDYNLVQVASNEETKNVQQEKQ